MKNLFDLMIKVDKSPSYKMLWQRNNTVKGKVPNKPGMYKFYDRQGKLLYVGHASRLRHRVQSYNQEDDYNAHPTKKELRPYIYSYSYSVMPEQKARQIEKKLKKKAVFNYL